MIELEAGENPEKDDHQHLEGYARVPCIGVKEPFLLVEVHRVLQAGVV